MLSHAEPAVSVPQTPTPLLIVFTDLTRYKFASQRVDDSELARVIDEHYREMTSAIEGAGGRVVKFIGDATLAVFPENAVDAGVRTVIELKALVDRAMAKRGWECRLEARAHFATVIAGDFGPEGAQRFDVIGKGVNAAAMLKTGGITLSGDAFHALSPDMQKQFTERAAGTYTPLS
jgi:adenylate cyclase